MSFAVVQSPAVAQYLKDEDLRLAEGKSKQALACALETLRDLENELFNIEQYPTFSDMPVALQRIVERIRRARSLLRPLTAEVLPLEMALPPLTGKIRFLLFRMGITTIDQIEATADEHFLRQRGFGPGSLADLRRAVAWAREGRS